MRFKHDTSKWPGSLIVTAFLSPAAPRPSLRARAELDTGADITCVPETLIEDLGVTPQGLVHVQGFREEPPEEVPSFDIRLSIDDTRYFTLEVISAPKDYVLLGRDFLNALILHADGPRLVFDLEYP